MALSRPWFTDGNILTEDSTTAANSIRSVLWGLKALLTGNRGTYAGTGLWTVEGSSDAVTFSATDNVDRWGVTTFTASKIVRGAAGTEAHSWFVLKSPLALGPMYLLIDYISSNDAAITIQLSSTPFTGGSLLNAPTSTKAWNIQEHASGASSKTFHDNTAGAVRLYRITDDDGNFWFTTAKSGTGIFHWFIGVQKLSNTKPGDLAPVFSFWSYTAGGRGGGSMVDINANLWNLKANVSNDTRNVRGRRFDDTGTYGISGTTTGIYPMIPMVGSTTSYWSSSSTTTNGIDGAHDIIEPVLLSGIDTGYVGYRGTVPDIAIVPNTVTVGGSVPTAASQERMCVGSVLIPSSVAPIL